MPTGGILYSYVLVIGIVKCCGADVTIKAQDLSHISSSQPHMFPWISVS